MRKVTREVCNAFIEGRPKRVDTTDTDGVTLRLHRNAIAQWRMDGLWITTAGWDTRTTLDRLQGLMIRCQVQQPVTPTSPVLPTVWKHRGRLMLGHQPWDGSWTRIEVNVERSLKHLALIASQQKEAA